jgi:hypothetical protein
MAQSLQDRWHDSVMRSVMRDKSRRRSTDRAPAYDRSLQALGYTLPVAVTIGAAIAIAIAVAM